jgi:glyoxylase-like metal-dependent hydrolase (beta-lactamase superfamily II)
MHAPEEIIPGVWHWTAPHPNIGSEVSSYWIEDGGVLVDPLVPPDAGLSWFAERRQPPAAVVLSNRHHSRETGRFVERFGCSVHVPRAGLHEFSDSPLEVTPYDPGDELPGHLLVHEIGSLAPDDMALHLPDAQAVFFADGVVLGGGPEDELRLGFVPDSLMDAPEQTKRGLLKAFEALLNELDESRFRHVLTAHGGPLLNTGRSELEQFVGSGGRTAFEF